MLAWVPGRYQDSELLMPTKRNRRNYAREYRLARRLAMDIDDGVEVGLGELVRRHRHNITGSDLLLELLQHYHPDHDQLGG